MDDEIDELTELEELLDFEDDDDKTSDDFGEDPEVAYQVGRYSDIDPDEECPYHEQDAIDEWKRGRAEADRHDIYAMRDGSPPDYYRDPD